MHSTDMHHAYIKSLMILIAGGPPHAGKTDRWLEDLSRVTKGVAAPDAPIGFRSLRAAWFGQRISKNQLVSKRTLQILEQAAENARKTRDIVEFAQLQLAIWGTAPQLFQPHIDLTREYLARLRQCDEECEQDRRRMAVSDGRENAATAAPAARLAAAKS